MIIGLTGKMAAGKGEVAEYLKKRGFSYFSCSDILRQILKQQGVEETIPNLIELGNQLRTKEGAGVLGKKLLQEIQGKKEKNAIADSIRNPAEIIELKKAKEKFVLLAIDAPVELRYQRTISRGRAGDQMTLEEFKEQDFKQLKSNDPNAQRILDCFELADYTVVNDGTLEKLYQQLDKILSII